MEEKAYPGENTAAIAAVDAALAILTQYKTQVNAALNAILTKYGIPAALDPLADGFLVDLEAKIKAELG
jgi:hypothetical protein